MRRFSTAALKGISDSRHLAAETAEVHRQWSNAVRARRGSAARRLLPRLLSQPAVTSLTVSTTLEVSRPAAQSAIDALVDAGVLRPSSAARRNRVWVAGDITALLDDFAGRARRATAWPTTPAWDLD